MNSRPFHSPRCRKGAAGGNCGAVRGQKQEISDILQSLVFTCFFKDVGQKGQYIFLRFKKSINI